MGCVLLAIVLQVKTALSLMIFYQILKKLFHDVKILQPGFKYSISILDQNHGGLVIQPQWKVLD